MTAAPPPESSNRLLERLSDKALLNEFSELVRQDHDRTASLLRHIDVIDRRKLWARQGHPSLFDFLVSRYHMSESTAGKRIGAARTARRFPILFTMVARGEIHLSGIHRLKAHLTRENHEQVLALAKHLTIRQIEELVARLAPQPDVPTTLRALPNRPAMAPTSAAPVPAAPALVAAAPDSPTAPARASVEPAGVAVQPVPAAAEPAQALLSPRRDPDPKPLAPGRYKLQVTISESTRDKLKQLQDLLAHQVPNGDPAAIIERALDALLVQIHKRKTGITAKPRASKARASKPTPIGRRTRHLKVAVRREVWPRDEGRCGFVGEDGHRCNETRGLEFAHVQPWGKGGADTAVNLGLRCIAHNAFEADLDFGTSFMASKRKREPLKVREHLARYALRGAMQVATERSHGSMPCIGSHAPASSSPRPPRRQRSRGAAALSVTSENGRLGG